MRQWRRNTYYHLMTSGPRSRLWAARESSSRGSFGRFVAENDLMSGIRVALEKVDASKPDTLTKASAKIGALFLQAGMPEDEIRNRRKSGETRAYRLWLRMARVRAPSVPL